MTHERVGVSTTTFANFNLSEGPKVVSARLQNDVYAPEIEKALFAIRMLGLSENEIVYRQGMKDLNLPSDTFVQMHGPVFYDLPHAIKEGKESSVKNAGINAMVALFAMGTMQNINATRKVAEDLNVKYIVLHPYGAKLAYERGIIPSGDQYGGANFVIEPDFKKKKRSDYIIYDPYMIVDLAHKTGFKVCIDTSHTVITSNGLSSLQEHYDFYKEAGVIGKTVHFSVAIPSPDGDFFTTDRGAEPLYRNTPDKIASHYREFVERVLSDGCTVIIEISSFPDTEKSRLESVKETLDTLFAPSTPATYSIPSAKT